MISLKAPSPALRGGTTCGAAAGGQLSDLIYTDCRDRRISEIGAGLRDTVCVPRPVLPARLHRVTLFTTFRCNFRCRYCRTIRNPAAGDMSLSDFTNLMEKIGPPVAHLHFTGGEPTLVRDLPEMAAFAAGRGIP